MGFGAYLRALHGMLSQEHLLVSEVKKKSKHIFAGYPLLGHRTPSPLVESRVGTDRTLESRIPKLKLQRLMNKQRNRYSSLAATHWKEWLSFSPQSDNEYDKAALYIRRPLILVLGKWLIPQSRRIKRYIWKWSSCPFSLCYHLYEHGLLITSAGVVSLGVSASDLEFTRGRSDIRRSLQ